MYTLRNALPHYLHSLKRPCIIIYVNYTRVNDVSNISIPSTSKRKTPTRYIRVQYLYTYIFSGACSGYVRNILRSDNRSPCGSFQTSVTTQAHRSVGVRNITDTHVPVSIIGSFLCLRVRSNHHRIRGRFVTPKIFLLRHAWWDERSSVPTWAVEKRYVSYCFSSCTAPYIYIYMVRSFL